MRTTLDLDDTLLVRAKALAARERLTLTRVIEEGLRLRLRPTTRHAMPDAPVPPIPIYHGRSGVAAGIDPLRNRSLFDAADEEDGGSAV